MILDRLSRRDCVRLLYAFGGLLVVLTLGQLHIRFGPLDRWIVELSVLGGLTAFVLGAVERISATTVDDDLFPTILGWCVGGAGFALLVAVLSVYYVGFSPLSHDAVFEYQLTMSLGGLGGLLAGFNQAKMVTEARNTAQTEAERQRLEYLNHLLRHDVLNNLGVIEGNLALVLDDPDREDAITRLETVQRQAREAGKHIENVRIVVQSAGTDHPLTRVDLSSVVDEELSHLRRTYPDAEITADVPPEVFVRADDLLGSVVENLVRNAVAHNDSETPRVAVTLVPHEGTVRTIVSDDGPGIPDSVRDALFEPPDEGAHGLGLYLVKTLVERYGGSITVSESTEDGTTVVVDLPRA